MEYVGVDLAWGDRAWTGLAVLDNEGRLLDVQRARSNGEILAWLRPHTGGPCLVAIDAPIVVVNLTGPRPSDRLVGRYFGHAQVSAHSSNLGLSSFRDGPRAGRLAEELGLDVDPESAGLRRALEVYPHPALVALFDLERGLRYKNRPGRDLALMKSEMRRIVALIDGLADADLPLVTSDCEKWAEIRSRVDAATAKAELAAVEDSVDAVVCAYVALFFDRRPDRVRVLGDAGTGYIATPVTMEIGERIDRDRTSGWTPTPRSRRAESVEDRAKGWVLDYERAQGREPRDTRHEASAVADVVSEPRVIEIKAYGGSARGEALWLEPRQYAEASANADFHLYVVDRVNDPSRTRLHDLHGDRLARLVAAARERRYYEVPWPVGDYDG